MQAAENLRHEERQVELVQLVTFDLDKAVYGVDVLKVREIIRLTSITRVPNTPSFVDGVINLRGKVIPVFSIRERFRLSRVEADSQTRIMVMEVAGELMGIIVDGVSEVVRINGSDIQPPPAVAGGNDNEEYVAGIVNLADRLLIVLDLEKLFSHQGFIKYRN